MDLKAVGQRIKSAREAKNLTQEELAALVNLSPTHVSVIERGLKVTKLDTFVAIANALDVSADTLLIDVVARATTSIKRVSAETSNAFAIATKVSNFVTFKPLSITLTCVGLKFTNAASSSCVRFFASRADLIRCPTAFKSIVTPPPERIIILNLVYLRIS